jgi:hypothetical protein
MMPAAQVRFILPKVNSPKCLEKRPSQKSISTIMHSPGTIGPEDRLFSGPWLIVRYKKRERSKKRLAVARIT